MNNMNKKWNDEERERVIEQALAAQSASEVAAADNALNAWVRAHPDDLAILDAFEVLSHRQDFAAVAASPVEPPLAAPAGRAA